MIGGEGNRTNLTNNKKDLNHIKSHMMSWGKQKMLEDGDDHENLVLKEKKGVVISGWHQDNNNKKKKSCRDKEKLTYSRYGMGAFAKKKKLTNYMFICLYFALLQKGFMATYKNIRLESYCIGP